MMEIVIAIGVLIVVFIISFLSYDLDKPADITSDYIEHKQDIGIITCDDEIYNNVHRDHGYIYGMDISKSYLVSKCLKCNFTAPTRFFNTPMSRRLSCIRCEYDVITCYPVTKKLIKLDGVYKWSESI